MDAETKTCSKCCEVKPVDAFQRGKGQCKSCVAAYMSLRYYADPDKYRAQVKAYRDADPEKTRAMKKARYDENPEKQRASIKAWRDANPDKYRAIIKARCENISDSYVSNMLVQHTSIKPKEVPQSLIDLKRVQVQITRKIKEIKKCK